MEWLKKTENPVLGAIIGALVTLIIQSSSATVGMAIILSKKGLLSLAGGIAVMLGAELGTCSDTLLATIKGSRAAIKTGLFHLTFNLLSIIIGLILGKMIGIFLTSWLAIKLKIASLNDMPTIRQFIGIATFGGIGFTMSIFISNLAISDVGLLNTAKLSVLLASILAALIGIIILWRK
jgi:Na+/phosphate symporter